MNNKKSLTAACGLALMASLGAEAGAAVDFGLLANKNEAKGEKCAKRPYLYEIAFDELTGNGVQVRPATLLLCTHRELTLADAGWMSALKSQNSVRLTYRLLQKPADK